MGALSAGTFIYFFSTWKTELRSPTAQKAPLNRLFLPLSLSSLLHTLLPQPCFPSLHLPLHLLVLLLFLLHYLFILSPLFSIFFSELAQSSPWVRASFPFLALCLDWQSLGYVCSFPELLAACNFLEMPLNLVGPLSFTTMFEVSLAGGSVVIECYWYISQKTNHSLENGLFL